jgi:Domain of Unknown Function (DUF928)
MRGRLVIAVVLALAVQWGGVAMALDQDAAPVQAPVEQPPGAASSPVYKPPLRGAPGGRVGGASRSAVKVSVPLPTIELLAPADHAGLTATAAPTLLFYVSRPAAWETRFTISAPMQPAPVLDVAIPSPRAAGIYALRCSDYRVKLQPGIVYTWSVSIVLDPRAWSRNIAASGTIVFDPTAGSGAVQATPPLQRAALLASAGLWYDAVAAAAEAQDVDRHAALDALIRQAGLSSAAGYAQQVPRRQ